MVTIGRKREIRRGSRKRFLRREEWVKSRNIIFRGKKINIRAANNPNSEARVRSRLEEVVKRIFQKWV